LLQHDLLHITVSNLFAGDPPEWFDLGKYFEIVTGLSQSVKNVITGGGREWIEDIIDTNDDLVYQMEHLYQVSCFYCINKINVTKIYNSNKSVVPLL